MATPLRIRRFAGQIVNQLANQGYHAPEEYVSMWQDVQNAIATLRNYEMITATEVGKIYDRLSAEASDVAEPIPGWHEAKAQAEAAGLTRNDAGEGVTA